MKRLIFTSLVTIASVAGAALAVRAFEALWKRALHERPPRRAKWIETLVDKSIHKPIAQRLVPKS